MSVADVATPIESRIKAQAFALGFDLCGIALLAPATTPNEIITRLRICESRSRFGIGIRQRGTDDNCIAVSWNCALLLAQSLVGDPGAIGR